MNKKAIAERLRELAFSDTNRSKAARLRDVFEDIELALEAGVSRSVVVDELAKHGLQMSLTTFETTLRRIRKKNGKLRSLPALVGETGKANSASQSRLEENPLPATTKNSFFPKVTAATADSLMNLNSSSLSDIKAIINDTPNLDELAKLSKRKSQ